MKRRIVSCPEFTDDESLVNDATMCSETIYPTSDIWIFAQTPKCGGRKLELKRTIERKIEILPGMQQYQGNLNVYDYVHSIKSIQKI